MLPRCVFPLFVCAGTVFAQASPAQNPAEITTHDQTPTFKTAVNEVMVPVVVRDGNGRAVGDLRREDFQLFDRGKLQTITKFTIEKTETSALVPKPGVAPPVQVTAAPSTTLPPAVTPDRFVAFLFDDVHAATNDLIMARDAADRHMKKSIDPRARLAIFTTSGQTMLDFTDDRDKWHEMLFRLQPRPIAEDLAKECPDLTYFWADRIRNQNDQEALRWALVEAATCGPPMAAPTLVRAAVARVIARNEHTSQVSLEVLRNAVKRMSVLPGQRTLVLVSPGFLTLIGSKNEESVIIDRAIRANLVINALDMRGLAVEIADSSRPMPSAPGYLAYRQDMDHEVFNARSDVMAELSNGTGGTFYHNNNDLDTGFQRVAGAPEYRYILGFSSQNLKMDGSIHALKVSLSPNPHHYDPEARRNYTAPKRLDDPTEAARAEIQEAIFSREEMGDIPVQVRTDFFKSGGEAEISVVTHVDLKGLHLRKVEGRNNDDLTITSALFDRNGNYVAGIERGVQLRLKEENFDRWMRNGISVTSTLHAKPGTYLVRVVVRDSEGQLMAARNAAVDIP
jgi:VWFA-related protein